MSAVVEKNRADNSQAWGPLSERGWAEADSEKCNT